MEKGIIKINGEVVDITYNRDSCISITLKYREVYEKLLNEPSYQLAEKHERDHSKLVEISYCGAAFLSKEEEQGLCLPEDAELNPYGFGAKTGDIHRGNHITVYALWHSVEHFEQTVKHVMDKIVIINHAIKTDQLENLVGRVASKAHPQQ